MPLVLELERRYGGTTFSPGTQKSMIWKKMSRERECDREGAGEERKRERARERERGGVGRERDRERRR